MDMKKSFLIIILLIIAIGSFSSVQATAKNVAFAIYLSQSRAWSEMPLSKLELLEEPLITDVDIIEYRWNTHEVILSKQGDRKYNNQSNKNRESGRVFVIVADGVRCYHGAFWQKILSASYPYPVILVDSTPPDIIKIERAYPSEKFAIGDDPRSDERIYKALLSIGKLRGHKGGGRFPNSYTGPDKFSSIEHLKRWAESGFGGGHLEELTLSGRKIFIADRCWTSGVYSSEVGIYVHSASDLILRYSIPVQHMYYHKFLIKGDRLIILRGGPKGYENVIVELSVSDLFGS
jgi:hypothetical protein